MGKTKVGTIYLDMVLNNAQFQKSLSEIQTQANLTSTKISSSFKKIGATIAAAFSTAVITSFAKSCIDLGSDLSEVQNVVDVTFTAMSGKVDEWAKNASKSFGLSETMAKRYVGAFGSMADSFGFTEQESYDMATALTGLAGDMASFYNITHDEAYTKLKSVFSGETETLKDLGIVMTQSALDAYALANGYGKTTSAMTEAEKVSLRFAFVQGQLKNAAGDFVRTQDNWANQTRVLQLRFDSLKATLGQGLINVLTPVLKVVNSLIERLTTVSEKFKALTEQFFGNADTSSAGGMSLAMEDGVNSAESLAGEANSSASALDSVAESAEKAKRSVAGFDKLNILTKDDTENTSDSLNQKTQTQSSGSGAVSALEKSVDNFTNAWNIKGKKVIDSIKNAFGNVKDTVVAIGKSWVNVWNNGTGEKVVENIKRLLTNCFDVIGDIAGAFTRAWNKGNLGNEVVQSIIDRWNSLIDLINVIGEDFRKVWNDGAGERIWTNILNIIKNCNEFTAKLREKIKSAWEKNETGERIWGTILGIVEDITGFLNDMSQIRLEWLESLDLSPVVTAVANLGEAFRELLKACGDKLKSAYKNILLPLAKWAIEDAVPKVVELLAEALKGIAAVVKKISDKTLYAIAGGIAAVGAAIVVFKAGTAIANGITKIRKAMELFITTVAAHPILAIAGAVTALIAGIETYNELKWENSSLKKELKKTAELTEQWNELGDEMSATIDEINDTELTMKVDFENVDKMKNRLQEIIEDGTIDESEKGEYKTIVDLLSEKVDGFDTQWNSLTLEEIDGKIVIKENIDDVNEKLDDLVTNWEIAQAKITFSDVYSGLQTDIAKKEVEIEVLHSQNNVGKSKDEFIDYIFENSHLSKKESEIMSDYLIESGGNIKDAVKELLADIDSGNIDVKQYDKLEFFTRQFNEDAGNHMFPVWGTEDKFKEYVTQINEYQSAIDDAESQLNSLKEKSEEYGTGLEALNEGTVDYNDYIKLSTEYGLSHEAVLSLLKDKGITSWSQLEQAAKESTQGTSDAVTKNDSTIQQSSERTRAKAAKNYDEAFSAPQVAIAQKGNSTKTAAQNFVSKILSPFSGLVSKIKEKISPITSVFSNIFKGIWAVIKDPLNTLMSNLESFINGFISALNSVSSGIDFAISSVGQIFGQEWHVGQLDKVKLPRFAKGAIVKAPTLAVVGDNPGASSGDPEVISPLSKLQGMIDCTSSSQDATILSEMLVYLKRLYEMFVIFKNQGGNSYEFVAKINGSEIFDEIIKQNELYKKRHGGKSAFA